MRFFLIDRITVWEPGERACAVKNVALSEDFFDDHFPLDPIMPGTLILEGMAQLSGLLLEETVRKATGRNVKALMSIVERAKYRRMVRPGETLVYEAEVGSFNELGGRVPVKATVEGKPVAECLLVFTLHETDNPHLEKRRSEILDLWLKGTNPDAV